jgi:hypothetical protein
MSLVITDFILRLILMVFFALFLYQSILNYKKAKNLKEPRAERYFLGYIIFFLFALINFIIGEIDLQSINIYGQSIYPFTDYVAQVGGSTFTLGIQALIFLAILIPSIIPTIYLIEKEIINLKYQILSILGIIITIFLVLVISMPPLITFVVIPVALGILILSFSFCLVYLKLVMNSDGIVRKSAFFSFIGWILTICGFMILGLISAISGTQTDPQLSAVIEHIVAIFGVILIYYGTHLARKRF